MAVSLDALLGDGKNHNVATVSVATTSAVASGGTIVLFASRFSGTAASTMSVTTTGGLTWNTAHNVSSGNIRIYCFWAYAPSGLASGTTLTVTNSAGNSDFMATALSLAGVDQGGSPVSAFNGSGATGQPWTSGNVTASSGDAMVGASFEDGVGTATSSPTAPAVEYSDFNDATQTEASTAAYKLTVSGTDVIAGTWSTSVTHVDIGVAFKAAASGVAASPRTFQAIPVQAQGRNL